MALGIRSTWLIALGSAMGILADTLPAGACPIPVRKPIAANMLQSTPWAANMFRHLEEVVRFDSPVRPALDGFRCEQTVGTCSLWLNRETGEIVLVDLAKPKAERISGFPESLGPIASVGLRNGRELVVRLKLSSYAMVVLVDLQAKRLTHIEYLPANLFEAEDGINVFGALRPNPLVGAQ
jgi:hypothetical protein